MLSSISYLNSAKARMRDSLSPEQTRISGMANKTCIQTYLALMLDSSSEDESQGTPNNGSYDHLLKSEIIYRNNKIKKKS